VTLLYSCFQREVRLVKAGLYALAPEFFRVLEFRSIARVSFSCPPE
jgi:hypothetical protein